MPTYTDCANPVYWTTTGTTTSTPINSLDLSGFTNSFNITPNTITWAYDNNKEYIEKLEKHIDELEEDIEYFNKQLEEKNEHINTLESTVEALKNKSTNMDMHITYLEGRLKALEERINT